MAGPSDLHELAVGQQPRKAIRNEARRDWRVFAAQEKDWEAELHVSTRQCWFAEQCMEIKWRLRCPTHQSALHRWRHRLPRSGTVPIVNEDRHATAIVACDDAFADAVGHSCNLGTRFATTLAHMRKQMECGRLVQRHASYSFGPGKSHV